MERKNLSNGVILGDGLVWFYGKFYSMNNILKFV